MAEIRTQQFRCPKCGKELELELIDSIEVPYDQELKQKVMDNSYFTLHCDGCNTVLPIGYRCTYNDLERRYLLWLMPNDGERESKEVEAYHKRLETDNALRLAQNGYRFRLVANSNDLREKILIFDAGLDDRVIELMKLAYVPSIRKKCGTESKIVGFYFDWRIDNKGGQWLIVLDNRKPLIAPFEMSMYNETKEKWQARIEEKTGEGLIKVNAKWAVEVMTE
jgi:hypothetical protein